MIFKKESTVKKLNKTQIKLRKLVDRTEKDLGKILFTIDKDDPLFVSKEDLRSIYKNEFLLALSER